MTRLETSELTLPDQSPAMREARRDQINETFTEFTIDLQGKLDLTPTIYGGRDDGFWRMVIAVQERL